MYIPQAYEVTDKRVIHSFLNEHGFALLTIADDAGAVQAVHLPLLSDEGGEKLVLAGHVAKANPICNLFDSTRQALAVFTGPHGYISPRWYSESRRVPTWNYTAVHVRGRPRVVKDAASCEAHLAAMVAKYEAGRSEPWGMEEAPTDYLARQMQQIVCFEIEAEAVEAKFKLSQDKRAADFEGAVKALREQGDTESTRLAHLMQSVRNG